MYFNCEISFNHIWYLWGFEIKKQPLTIRLEQQKKYYCTILPNKTFLVWPSSEYASAKCCDTRKSPCFVGNLCCTLRDQTISVWNWKVYESSDQADLIWNHERPLHKIKYSQFNKSQSENRKMFHKQFVSFQNSCFNSCFQLLKE